MLGASTIFVNDLRREDSVLATLWCVVLSYVFAANLTNNAFELDVKVKIYIHSRVKSKQHVAEGTNMQIARLRVRVGSLLPVLLRKRFQSRICMALQTDGWKKKYIHTIL